MEPRHFSFNSPFGACPTCSGLGVKRMVNEELILGDPSLTLQPWSRDLPSVSVLGQGWLMTNVSLAHSLVSEITASRCSSSSGSSI